MKQDVQGNQSFYAKGKIHVKEMEAAVLSKILGLIQIWGGGGVVRFFAFLPNVGIGDNIYRK